MGLRPKYEGNVADGGNGPDYLGYQALMAYLKMAMVMAGIEEVRVPMMSHENFSLL
jgi:hypothetical protein